MATFQRTTECCSPSSVVFREYNGLQAYFTSDVANKIAQERNGLLGGHNSHWHRQIVPHFGILDAQQKHQWLGE